MGDSARRRVEEHGRDVLDATGVRWLGRKTGLYDPAKARQDKNIAEDAGRLQKRQETLIAKQEKEIGFRKRKLTRTQMQFLKARFSLSGGARASVKPPAGAGGLTPGDQPGTSSADLFGRITGRN